MIRRDESNDSTPTSATTSKNSSVMYESDLRTRLATFPRDVLAWFALGKYLRSLGRLKEAEEALRKAVLLNPGPIPFWEELALTLVDLGQLDEAYTICDKRMRKNDDSIQKRLEELKKIERSVDSKYPEETSPCIACPEYTYYGCSRGEECDAIVRWRSAMSNVSSYSKNRT
ncbi:MAG: tetratricopeptide repeat protein [Candidatus Thorarchaeota archaeon]|jgi:tetratricopeptide (TPR) repeat protein